jgi:hypothetical protein
VSTPTVGDATHTSHPTIAGRLTAARRQAFVGRASELDLFRSALVEDPPAFSVLFLHGPGGIGKSALLRRLADEAEQAGRVAVRIDCATAGYPATFLPSLAAALGLPPDEDPLPALHASRRAVLLLDTYEAVPGLDGWLRDAFLPSMPAETITVIAGRDPPPNGWREDPGWHDLLRVVALRNLAPDDARALLASRHVAADLHDRVLALTGGHPLALSLIADVVAQTGVVPDTHADAPDVTAALLPRFASDLPTTAHRRALEVVAHAQRTTASLLASVLPEADAHVDELFTWLRALSFVEATPLGLVAHDLAREVLDADLRWRDREGYRALHRSIREHIVARVLTQRGSEQDLAMQELMYLHRNNPLFAPYLAWDDRAAVSTRPLTASDVPALEALATSLEGERSGDLVAFWGTRRPEAFQIFERPGQAAPSGFSCCLDMASFEDDEVAADPVIAAVLDAIRAHAPLRAGDRVVVQRHWFARHAYGRPSPEADLMQRHTALRWFNCEQLAWSVNTVPAAIAPDWEPQMLYMDMPRLLDTDVLVGGTAFALYGRDWRPSPVDAWLEWMGERELQIDLDHQRLAHAERPVSLVVLSQPEFADAVREALRTATRPDALATNPLLRSRVVRDVSGDRDPGQALADLVVEAVDALRDGDQGDKLHRAMATTYFKGVATQEAAAQRLGLPFSTYRRHLTAGIERVTAWLWDRELHGPRV